MLTKIFVRLTVGLATAIALCFLIMVATVAASALTTSPVSIPFVFSATVITESGLPAVEFVPNIWGFGVVALLVVTAFFSRGFHKRTD